MLCPEVYKFSPPNILLDGRRGNEYNLTEINKTVSSHYFNHLVSVVLPDVGSSTIPGDITNTLLEDTDYYRVEDVDVTHLIQKEFLDAFVKRGRLTGLSDNTRIDTTDCASITPSGHLVLVLNRSTYQELGLEGKPSNFCSSTAARYVVCLDLRAEHFQPGKKNYTRVQWCLTHGPRLKFNFLFSWEPPDEEICPSSVAAYMSSIGYRVTVCHNRFVRRTDYSVMVPQMSDELHKDNSSELLEWLGIFSMQGDIDSGAPDSFLNTYQPPEESKLVGSVVSLQWTGFFTCGQILQLLTSLRNYVAAQNSCPWVSLYVQGFADSPVSWGLQEHYYYTSGENDYTLFLKPNGNYLLYKILSSNRKPQRKLSSKMNKR